MFTFKDGGFDESIEDSEAKWDKGGTTGNRYNDKSVIMLL
jgi:hypothetical protein